MGVVPEEHSLGDGGRLYAARKKADRDPMGVSSTKTVVAGRRSKAHQHGAAERKKNLAVLTKI